LRELAKGYKGYRSTECEKACRVRRSLCHGHKSTRSAKGYKGYSPTECGEGM